MDWFLLVVSITLLAGQRRAAGNETRLVDRIVAVVDHHPILLSELRARMKPGEKRLDGSFPVDGDARRQAEWQLRRATLDEMIDDELVDNEVYRILADDARSGVDTQLITVLPSDVDAALQTIAQRQHLSVSQLVDAAHDAGMSEREFRDRVRRELLDEKVMARRVTPQLQGLSGLSDRAPAAERAAARRRWLDERRAEAFIEVRL